ncbi:MAG: ATP phosphoribosyltransferase [Epsilonproteobacteria bacterium]|nr:ATP phosphoribosyltransferase [Campylobacterota bacterium]
MVTVALPKGRIAQQTLHIFEQIFKEKFEFKGRELILKKAGFTFLNVRNWDVATYVEYQAADIGVVGYDVIKELNSDVMELLDMKLGVCKVCVGGIANDDSYKNKTELTVATKLQNIAREYFSKKGIPTKIIKLNGSIELAPLIGLSDVIVDIVETGTTMKENGLEIKEDVLEYVSARLIANKNSFVEKKPQIIKLYESMKELV